MCVLILRDVELNGLRRALRLLEARARAARVVATFAMGGLPLLHWLTFPASSSATDAAAVLANALRYHLLAGLNWPGVPSAKADFRAWLSGELASPGEVLIFDTGTEGNGVREARNEAIQAIRGAAPVQGVVVAIVGVVDGRPRESEHHTIEGTNGVTVIVTVEYERVPHLPTEDNGLLLGYDADKRTGRVHPVAGLLLYRIEETPTAITCLARAVDRLGGRCAGVTRFIAKCGHCLSRHAIVATSTGANTITALVRSPSAFPGNRFRKGELEWGTAAMLLAHAQASELVALETAIDAGIGAPPPRAVVVARHEREQAELLGRRWSREQKRVIIIGV